MLDDPLKGKDKAMSEENLKRSVLVEFTVFTLLCCGSVSWANPRTKRDVERPLPQANVMVEAVVIRMAASDYYGLGISPIGLTHPSALMDKLAAHVKDHPESVIAGMKGNPSNHHRIECEERRGVYVTRVERGETNYDAYSSGKEFAAVVRSQPDKSLRVEYAFTYSLFDDDRQQQGPPPDTHTWRWKGSINMKTGQPVVAGSHLDDQHVVILILTSHLLE